MALLFLKNQRQLFYVTIIHAAYLQMTIEITNPTTPSSKAMPHGHSFFLETCTAAAGLAEKDIVIGTGVYVTTAKHIIKFQASDKSKTCYRGEAMKMDSSTISSKCYFKQSDFLNDLKRKKFRKGLGQLTCSLFYFRLVGNAFIPFISHCILCLFPSKITHSSQKMLFIIAK